MSCTVKISGKGWSGSQRKINSLAEEGPQLSGTVPLTGTIQGSTKVTVSRTIKSNAIKKGEDTYKLLKYIDDNIIGKNITFFGPFGRRKVVYCDYTASGRSLQFLEDYILKEVLPFLGDTRASTSICSLQSSLFRHEARDIIRHVVGASEQDAVLFTGQGTAGALRTLLYHLDFTKPTVVFVGPFEHYANLQPWQESGAKVIRINETKEGFLDLNDLERKLLSEKTDNPSLRIVGYFSVASCITGVLADDVATTLLLRQYGAFTIWDYTAAAPYVKIEMNPHLPGVNERTVHKDAIIFSGHKFIGGLQSPGVLIVKKTLLRDAEFETKPDYLKYFESCNESGTAGVVEEIRLGLVMQLKENITPQAITARHDKITKQVLSHIRTIPELILLGSGSQNVKRLPTFSFLVRHPRGMFLHHNFVCAVLNDVFGVQARGGCICAGRYAYYLMGIDETLAKEYESLLLKGAETENAEESTAEPLRPGFARISFPFFMSEMEVGFVLEALKMVATEGWKLLPQYVLNPDTGEWRHHTNSVFKDRRCLGTIRYTDGKMNATERRISGAGVFPQSHSDCLQTARNIFNRARKMAQRCPLQIDRNVPYDAESEALRWFMLPKEAQDLLLGNSQNVKTNVPFDPNHCRYLENSGSSPSNNNFVMRRLNSDVPRSGNPPISPMSPRHNSLPVLTYPPEIQSGKRRMMTRMQDVDSGDEGFFLNSGQRSPATCPASPLPTIKFALGEAVTSAAADVPGITPTTVNRLITAEHHSEVFLGRIRCNSLGSSGCISSGGGTSPVPIPLSPQTLASLGIATAKSQSRHRHCSCSSQTDLNGSDNERSNSPNRSSSSLGHVPSSTCSSPFDSGIAGSNRIGRSSPVPSIVSQSSEDDLRAYLKEVTKELATEIKSEIREVISKVDDALSETNTSETTPQHRSMDKQQTKQENDSMSARDIAEYLMEFSKEMASEVKSEIRCMVNSVDGLHRYSPDDRSSSGCASPAEKKRMVLPLTTNRARTPVLPGKIGELTQNDSKVSSECSSDETVIYVVKPSPSDQGKNTDEDEVEEDDENAKERAKALPKIYSAVNSVSSQDSGINLSFHESDRSVDSTELGRSSSAESTTNCNSRRQRLSTNAAFQKQPKSTNDDVSEDEEICLIPRCVNNSEIDDIKIVHEEEDHGQTKQLAWHCLPKNIWKPTVEAIQEYDMIKDNDRILLCLSLHTSNSLTLLHTLHQYQCYARSKGIDFEIGVVTVDVDGRLNLDPIKDYMQSLDIPFYYEEAETNNDHEEEQSSNGTKSIEHTSCSFCEKATRTKLYAIAKREKYNVLGLGQTLDDLTDNFLASVFYNGKLKTLKAHYYIREQDLRVIRPFVYVREKALKQFAESKKLPLFRVTSCEADDEQHKRSRKEEFIAYQEQTHPRLYWSLRSALKPLITARGQMNDSQQSQQQQKRQQLRRPRTNSFNSSPISGGLTSMRYVDESDETDEEPVL